jgi:hypothetical protein
VIKPPVGEAYVSIEAPKGELGYFIVSDGSTQPYRLRVRPRRSSIAGPSTGWRGALVADVVAIIGMIDIVLGEIDRRSAPCRTGPEEAPMVKLLRTSFGGSDSRALGDIPQPAPQASSPSSTRPRGRRSPSGFVGRPGSTSIRTPARPSAFRATSARWPARRT